MSLRAKFHILLAIFGLAVTLNGAIAVICVKVYIDVATERFHLLSSDVHRVDVVRTTLDDLILELDQRTRREKPLTDDRHRILCREIIQQVAELREAAAQIAAVTGDAPVPDAAAPETRTRLSELADQLDERCIQLMELLRDERFTDAGVYLTVQIKGETIGGLRRALAGVSQQSNTLISKTAEGLAGAQRAVTFILAVTAIVMLALVAGFIHLVRRWMLRPVEAIGLATMRHAAGDLEYRIPNHSRDELGVLSRQVNEMADSLAAIQRRMVEQSRLAAVGEVASSIAHNIRNPLAAIRATMEHWRNRADGDTAMCESLSKAIDTTDALNKWLHELLTVNAPIDLKYETILVRDLVDRVVAVTGTFAERRGVRLEVEHHETIVEIQADISRIRGALTVLLDNAIEASPPGSSVRLLVSGTSPPDCVELRVIDHGTGIPEEIRAQLAKPFVTNKPGGTGIGLFTARRAVQAHGGAIEFIPNPDRGTSVILTVPILPHDERTPEGIRLFNSKR